MFSTLKRLFGAHAAATPAERHERAMARLRERWSLDAFIELRSIAEEGLAAAQYDLAHHYERAIGVVQDLADALRWYERAAEQGHTAAQARAGLILMSAPPARDGEAPAAAGMATLLGRPDAAAPRQDHVRAARWNRLAAEAGDAGAQMRLGLQHAAGLGVARDHALARDWLERSAAQRDPGGMTALGVLLAGGHGGTADLDGARHWLLQAADAGSADAHYWLGVVSEQAAAAADAAEPTAAVHEWLRRAAEQGHVGAMYRLGLACWAGRGTPRDLGAAETWLRRASARDHIDALRALAQMQLEQADSDGVEAATLLWQAAERGDRRSAALLGELFLQGRGVPRDAIEAARWLICAGSEARPQALTGLAGLHASGPDSLTGHIEARVWLERADAAGDLAATFTLGSLYRAGMGVERDDHRARDCYRRAAEAGSSGAAFHLGMLHADTESQLHDDRLALHWLDVAARRRHALAVCNLATLIHQGRGRPADTALALSILESAAVRGNLPAAVMAAQWHLDGLHREPDPARAHALLRPAVALGDAHAAALMTELHLRHGLPADRAALVALLAPAADRPRPGPAMPPVAALAAQALAALLAAEQPAPDSTVAARIRDLRERAARAGLPDSQLWMAQALAAGPDFSSDAAAQAQAADWLDAAARRGHPDALLARDSGLATDGAPPPDDALFGAWVAASATGHAAAQRELGRRYLHGQGCPRNPDLAVRWLRRAAELGDSAAARLLAECRAAGYHGVWRPRRLDPADAIELVGPEVLHLPAPAGRQWFDPHCKPEQQRDYAPVDIELAPVRAWRLAGACISAEFVVHRDDELYLDSSLLLRQRSADADTAAASLIALADACDPAPDTTWQHEQALCMHNEGGDTWGHFLIQNLPCMLLFLQRFPAGKLALPAAHVSYVDEPGPAQMLALLGIPADRLLPLERDRCYRFGEVVLMDHLFDFEAGLPHPLGLRLIRDAVDGIDLPPPPEPGSPIGFIERWPAVVGRLITNLDELRPLLAKAGATLGPLGSRPIAEQIAVWRAGGLKICTLGSDLSNLVFAPPGSAVLVLTPDWFGDDFFYRLAQSLGVRWYELRCGRRSGQAEIAHRAGFEVEADGLARALETVRADDDSAGPGTPPERASDLLGADG